MLEQFPPQPDDTLELAVMPAHRRVALIVSAAVVAIGVLIGVGFLVFGGLGASGGGLRSPGLLPAISPQPDSSTPPLATSAPPAQPTAATSVAPIPTPITTPPRAVAVSITNATMKPRAYVGPDCPASTTGIATVTAAGPVTITYRWVSSAMVSAGTASFTFGAAGSHRFSHAFPNITTPNGRVTATFVIVTPAPRRASMTYTQKCGASASKITPKITKDLTGLTCSVTFMSTIHAGVGPMTVSYHWELTGAGPGADSRSWTFPQGGGNHLASSSTRTLKRGNSATATLVLGTPVRFVTRTVTVTCQ